MVAGSDERDPLPHALDHTGPLVAEDARGIPARVRAGRGVEVGVAHAAGCEPDEHLAGPRLRQVDLLDGERLPELLEDGGTDPHDGTILCRSLDGRHVVLSNRIRVTIARPRLA